MLNNNLDNLGQLSLTEEAILQKKKIASGNGVVVSPPNIKFNINSEDPSQNITWSEFCNIIKQYGFNHLTDNEDNSSIYRDSRTGLVLVAKSDNSVLHTPRVDYAYVCGEVYDSKIDLRYTGNVRN